MHSEKTQLLKQLDEARDYLWRVLDALEPASPITPEWNQRDFFAHLAGWEALAFEIFRNYAAGVPGKAYPYIAGDDENRNFVNSRQSLSVDDAKLECEINRFALKTLLQSIPAEGYQQPIPFPRGSHTIVEFIQEAIQHEREHADEIVKMRPGSPSG